MPACVILASPCRNNRIPKIAGMTDRNRAARVCEFGTPEAGRTKKWHTPAVKCAYLRSELDGGKP